MSTEIQVYLAKFMPDSRRNEPRNVGLIVRTADDTVFASFLCEGEETCNVPKQLDLVEHSKKVGEWRAAIDKYGVKALNWIGKRKQGSQFFIEFSHGEMVQGFKASDLKKMFNELVL